MDQELISDTDSKLSTDLIATGQRPPAVPLSSDGSLEDGNEKRLKDTIDLEALKILVILAGLTMAIALVVMAL